MCKLVIMKLNILIVFICFFIFSDAKEKKKLYILLPSDHHVDTGIIEAFNRNAINWETDYIIFYQRNAFHNSKKEFFGVIKSSKEIHTKDTMCRKHLLDSCKVIEYKYLFPLTNIVSEDDLYKRNVIFYIIRGIDWNNKQKRKIPVYSCDYLYINKTE